MPARRLKMRKLKELLRLKYDNRLTHRQIATACKCSAGTVSDICSRFRASGLSWNKELTDTQLNRALYPAIDLSQHRPEPDWVQVHTELRRKDVHLTRALLWEEYKRSEPTGYSYSWFCDKYEDWLSKVEPSMRLEHKFGEKCFVDFAGDTLGVYIDGEVRQAQVFVACLGGSNYTYCDLCWSQSLPDWIEVHNRMLEHFGGVPELIVPDNLKSAVTKPNYAEPSVNITYEEFAKYNGCAIVPARVGRPKDKAKVENAVLNVERQVLAPLRNGTFYSLSEARKAVSQQTELLNSKPFQKLPGTRLSMFTDYEKEALRPLPKGPFQFGQWKERMVDTSYHVEFETSYYSVPFELCREKVELRVSTRVVEILHKGQRVAIHQRSCQPGQLSTHPEHRPPHHRYHAEFDLQEAKAKLSQPGPNAAQFVNLILKLESKQLHSEQQKRICQSLLKSLRKYSGERYEKACHRALSQGAIRCESLASILRLNLDRLPVEDDNHSPQSLGEHENVRGSDYYEDKGAQTV